jgi:group I intron endonuclease
MTIGIYALYWEEQDLIYVGQSQDVERRYKAHMYHLKLQDHKNSRIQHTYTLFGEPKLVILEECCISQLLELEIGYISEFSSAERGLNILMAKPTSWGTNSANSKYTKRQILSIFSLLYKGKLTCPQIAKRLKVNTSTVENICGSSHLWLKEEYPEQYALMKQVNRRAHKRK